MAREGSHSEQNCFDDEVIIDFPSVATAVDRIRHAFLRDERPTTVRTAIQLSSREAHTGAVVPLDLPVRCTCRGCGGRGESWTESCVQCRGTGDEVLTHPVQVTVPAGVVDGARFHFAVTVRHSPPTPIELRVSVI